MNTSNKSFYPIIIAGALVVIALGITVVNYLTSTTAPADKENDAAPVANTFVRPPQPAFSSDQRCTWGWKEISDVGFWAEKCIYDDTTWDHTPGIGFTGFNLTMNGEVYAKELEVFQKSATESMDSVLARLQSLGSVPADDCVMQQNTAQSSEAFAIYEVVPVGKRLARMEASSAIPEVPADECGDYGVSADAQRFFQVFKSNPTKVIFANLGQDGALFNVETITVKPL